MPAAVGNRVVKDAVAQHVVFVEHVVALQTAAFAHAGQHAYPYQLVVFRAVVAAVLDVIPHAVYRAHQLIADVLVLADDIGAFAADFDPPVAVILAVAVKEHPDFVFAGLGQHFLGHVSAVLAIAQLLLGKVHGVHGRDELDRMAHIGGLEQQGVAHAILVGLLGSVRLVKLRLALAACAALYAHKSAQGAVARAVGKDFAMDQQPLFGAHLIALDAGDFAVLAGGGMHGGVEQQRQVLFVLGGLEQHRIPDGKIIAVVHALVA